MSHVQPKKNKNFFKKKTEKRRESMKKISPQPAVLELPGEEKTPPISLHM